MRQFQQRPRRVGSSCTLLLHVQCHAFWTNGPALYFLRQYFECHHLRWVALQFCKRDLSIENLGIYYKQAKATKDDKLLQLVAKKCCKELEQIRCDSQLMKESDVILWENIIQLVREGRAGTSFDSKYLGRLLAEFCTLHPSIVNATIFAHFTEEAHMPKVDAKNAVPLLKLEAKLLPESKTGKVFTNLQNRCVKAIVDTWGSIEAPVLQHELSDLRPHLLMCFETAELIEKLQRQVDTDKKIRMRRELRSRKVKNSNIFPVPTFLTFLVDSWLSAIESQ